MHGLLNVVASLVVEQGLQGARASAVAAHGLSRCSSWSLEHKLNGMWNLLNQGSNLCLRHWQADSLSLRHQGSPCICICICIYVYLYTHTNINLRIPTDEMKLHEKGNKEMIDLRIRIMASLGGRGKSVNEQS